MKKRCFTKDYRLSSYVILDHGFMELSLFTCGTSAIAFCQRLGGDLDLMKVHAI